jgi:shikimate dehydrogenase
MTVRRACVIGHPVAHARSPLIHRYWLAEHRIEGDYGREDVPPEKIDDFFANFARSGYVGGNITLPHKEAAFRALARAEPVAAALRAVNAIWLEDGRLAGTNTDVHGFLANFDEARPGWSNRAEQAVVLGAGGGARAVVYGLLQRNVGRVVVVNRTPVRAKAIADELGERVKVASFGELRGLLERTDILVNATKLGMTGQPPLEIDLASMRDGAMVYDIVYVPLETTLLAAARARGLHAIDGLGMLLHQAVPAFERWFGIRPAVSEGLREALLADLGARKS